MALILYPSMAIVANYCKYCYNVFKMTRYFRGINIENKSYQVEIGIIDFYYINSFIHIEDCRYKEGLRDKNAYGIRHKSRLCRDY